MQLVHVNAGFEASDAVNADVARIEAIWDAARKLSGSDGWLMGDYSLADVFFAPVAARIIGFNLKVSDAAQDYCLRTISDPIFREWRSEGLKVNYDPFPYPVHEPINPWPVA
jgi:glutathione S-transferase